VAEPDFPIADAHLHLWDAQAHRYPWLNDQPIAFRYGDYSALPRRYLLDGYRRDAGRWNVARGVHIEAEWDPHDPVGEMDFIAELRRRHSFPTVAIAQAWLDRDDCAAVLEAQASHSFVRGVRHKPRPSQMDDARWRTGYRRLAPLHLHFELQAPWRQLDEAARLARDFPDTTIVLNHAGLPLAPELDAWRRAMAQLAGCANVMVKISGLGSLDAAAKREVILATIELFDTQRAMFASNYPVDSLRGSFDAIYGAFDATTRDLSPAERANLFHDNAVRIYRME
jgi:predicted TIM-barrel fold metal-dependent hydrolase